jgi:polyhydroxybutyrate depolymerase
VEKECRRQGACARIIAAWPMRFPTTIAPSVAIVVVGLASGAMFLQFQASAGVSEHYNTIQVDGRMRSYFVHVPPNYNGKNPLPLVLVLHGATQSAEGAERMSGMSAVADKENFLVVYPTGTSQLGHAPTWNAGNCCGYALANNVDDVAFFRNLIDTLEREYDIDSKRIFVTGISNGAMMSFRIACELANQVAAVAPVEGAQNIKCNPTSPVSVVIFHGTADRLVPFEGGETPFQLGPRRWDASVAAAVGFWVKRDGCLSTPKHEETKEVHIDIYSGCKDGSGVALYAIQGGHHMWPGTPMSRNRLPATDIMWEFFAQHPKP